MKKFDTVKNIISLFIVFAIISSLLIYYTRTYLFLPFTVPAPIEKVQGLTFDMFKKPVEVEVMTDSRPYADKFERCVYFPENKTQYDKLARKYVDFYANILSNGSKISFDSYEIQNLNMTGTRYVINLRCGEAAILPMDFMDGNEIIRMGGNDYYIITPELRDQLLNYIKETYTIKEVIT